MPGSDRAHINHVFAVIQRVAVIALIHKQRTAVLHQRIDLKVPVIKIFTEQEVAAAAAASAPLFHHINIAVAVAIQVVRRITGIFNKRILIKREHIVGFEATDFNFPVILLTKEKGRIIKIHFTVHIRQRLHAESGIFTVSPFA